MHSKAPPVHLRKRAILGIAVGCTVAGVIVIGAAITTCFLIRRIRRSRLQQSKLVQNRSSVAQGVSQVNAMGELHGKSIEPDELPTKDIPIELHGKGIAPELPVTDMPTELQGRGMAMEMPAEGSRAEYYELPINAESQR